MKKYSPGNLAYEIAEPIPAWSGESTGILNTVEHPYTHARMRPGLAPPQTPTYAIRRST
jgi:hypothetical protein